MAGYGKKKMMGSKMMPKFGKGKCKYAPKRLVMNKLKK